MSDGRDAGIAFMDQALDDNDVAPEAIEAAVLAVRAGFAKT